MISLLSGTAAYGGEGDGKTKQNPAEEVAVKEGHGGDEAVLFDAGDVGNGAINAPRPECFVEFTCIDTPTECTLLYVKKDGRSQWLAGATYRANKYVHRVCVAYNGVIARFVTREWTGFYEVGFRQNSREDAMKVVDWCTSTREDLINRNTSCQEGEDVVGPKQ